MDLTPRLHCLMRSSVVVMNTDCFSFLMILSSSMGMISVLFHCV